MSIHESASVNESSPKPAKRPLLGRWPVLVAASALVAVSSAAGYTLGAKSGADPGDKCGGKSIEPSVAVDSAEFPDNRSRFNALEVVDQGFLPYRVGDGDDAAQYASFGFVVKNTTKKVIHNAFVQVYILDSGESVTAAEPELGPLEKDTRARLENVLIPEIQPGQKVGMGESVLIGTAKVSDPESGETTTRQPVKVDDLTVAVEIESAQWWYKKNATYEFTDIEVGKTSHHQPETLDGVYENDSKAVMNTVDYDVNSTYCRPLLGYVPSSVVHDKGGSIIGGSISGRLATKSQEDAYGGERVYVSTPEPDQSYPAGRGSSDNQSPKDRYNFGPIEVQVPEKSDPKFTLYPYTLPITPTISSE